MLTGTVTSILFRMLHTLLVPASMREVETVARGALSPQVSVWPMLTSLLALLANQQVPVTTELGTTATAVVMTTNQPLLASKLYSRIPLLKALLQDLRHQQRLPSVSPK